MDKATQNSLINTVNNIVNQEEPCKECEMVTRVEAGLELFEELFQLELTEEQEDQLIEVGFTHLFEGKKSKQIDLNEDIQVIIEENSPEEVFCYIVEFIQFLAPLAASALGGGAAASALGTAGGLLRAGVGMIGSLLGGNKGGGGGGGSDSDSTANPFGSFASQNQSAQAGWDKTVGTPSEPAQVGEDGVRRRGRSKEQRERERTNLNRTRELGRVSAADLAAMDTGGESGGSVVIYPRRGSRRIVRGPLDILEGKEIKSLKKKKKVFKIIYVDKGVKKKGTAVSHKGVARIVSDKSVFKVFDEKNNDITSQFKSGKKQTKHEKK